MRPSVPRVLSVRVIPGKRASNPALQSISPEYAFAFKLALVVIVTIAVLCSVRVWLSASTVALLENVNAVESTLASAQARPGELEVPTLDPVELDAPSRRRRPRSAWSLPPTSST